MTPEQAKAHFEPAPERKQWSLDNLPFIKKLAEQIDSGQLSHRKAAVKYNVTRYEVVKWVNYVKNKTVVGARSLKPQDLPMIEEIVREIKLGKITIPEASKKYKFYSFEIKKWIRILTKEEPLPDLSTIDLNLKKQIIEAVYYRKLSRKAAARKYNVSPDIISLWVSKLPNYKKPTFSEELQVTDQIKVEIVRKIQSGSLTSFRAASEYNIHRAIIHRWVNDFSIFNADGTVCYTVLHNMKPEEQNKELIEQIEKLKQELEHEKLKNEALQTLIQVAEEKFGLEIKKKPGQNPSKK